MTKRSAAAASAGSQGGSGGSEEAAPQATPTRSKRGASAADASAPTSSAKRAATAKRTPQSKVAAAAEGMAAAGDAAASDTAAAAAAAEVAATVAAKKPRGGGGGKGKGAAAPAASLPHYSVEMRAPLLPPGAPGTFRLLSWNVAGLRALLQKDAGALTRLVAAEQPDVLCLQETKLQAEHVSDAEASSKLLASAGGPFSQAHFNCSTAKKGYSGVAVFCRSPALSVAKGIGAPEHDDEGRVLTVELPDLFVVNVYVPNSGEGLKRLEYRTGSWDVAFAAYIRGLEAKKPVIVTGDLNCAHTEIDIHNPKGNLRSAGFTQEERDSFSAQIIGAGYVDTFRRQHPGVVGYTYYSYRFNARANNKGWRLDYCLASAALEPRLHDAFILPTVTGSDHVPLGLVLKAAQ